jgi:NNP family nitrate/nitrite transporter-like MFS transporter
VVFSPLTDRYGGARWTLVSGVGILVSLLWTLTTLDPEPAAGAAALEAQFQGFLWGMVAIFFFTGIGNASTFKQMPMIFERRQAGGVIGWTAAIAAYGPFAFGLLLATTTVPVFFWIGVVFTLVGITITWVRYARPGAPRPS